MILAARFGGTPWEWRERASPLDWGTAVSLLEHEAEQAERQTQTMRDMMETR